jgi:hypothetical protein
MKNDNLPATRDETLSAPIVGVRKSTLAIQEVDSMFLGQAQRALAAAGCTALEFLRANPGASTVQLAKLLNHGASALGLVMAVYDEALNQGAVRETAKDLLIREILAEFPEGWNSAGDVRPGVKVGGWRFELKKYGRDKKIGECASRIIRELTIDRPPAAGWKPKVGQDPLIDELFDLHWPNEGKENAGCLGQEL